MLNGSTLALAGVTPTITNTNTNTNTNNATINSVLAGTAGLVKAGNAAPTLGGSNTFSGGITINAGTLNADSNAALGAAGNTIATAAGATVGFGLASGSTNRCIALGTGGASTVVNRGTLTVADAGSTFNTVNLNAVSATGSAIINVENGASLRASTLNLRASGSLANAQLNISGAVSLATVTGTFAVASSAAANAASITISDGGRLRTGMLNTIGALAGNTAPPLVTIAGGGSNWTAACCSCGPASSRYWTAARRSSPRRRSVR